MAQRRADTAPVALEDRLSEALLVLSVVAALACAAALLLRLLAVLGATPGGGEVGAPGDGADGKGSAPGH